MGGSAFKDKRPVYLNLFKIRLPVAAVVSLAHRLSGILMFLAMPFIVYLLDLSVQSSAGFEQAMTLLQHPLLLAVQILLVWALAHHLFSGIRFLLIDADLGVDRQAANYSAWLVIALSVLTTVIVSLGLLL
ncbi:MAG: succinate dehydrogenase, cytochrome b556 subunit [Gammaproteobacteria bacterium]|nr:succinate dehydrogenase, cytochrome b556 subunit [Gammaproteobacteria bacterium]